MEQGTIIAPAKTLEDMHTIVFSNQINAVLCAFFMIVAVVMLLASFRVIYKALHASEPTVHEAEIVYENTSYEKASTDAQPSV